MLREDFNDATVLTYETLSFLLSVGFHGLWAVLFEDGGGLLWAEVPASGFAGDVLC